MKLKLKYYALLLMVLCAVAVVATANADEGHGHDHHDDGGGDIDITGGDVNVPVNVGPTTVVDASSTNLQFDAKSLGLSNSLGDVDLTGICQGSTQWGTPVFSKQKIQRDETCVGFKWLSLGRYKLAKMHFCMDKATRKQYDSVEACEAEHNFAPMGPQPVAKPETPPVTYYEHTEDIEQVQMAQNNLVDRIEALEQKPAPRVVRAAPPAPAPQPRYSKEQRLAVFSKLGIKDEEDE